MSRALQHLAAGLLRRDDFPTVTGAGVRIAVIDSGVGEPETTAGEVLPGVSFDAAGVRGVATGDRHGHGSAVAAAIRAVAPRVSIVPVQVFEGDLRATADALAAALDWASQAGVALVNLSLGTTNGAHRLRLGEALVRAARAGVTVVAADVDEAGTAWLPGCLPLAVGVSMDRSVAHHAAVISITQEGAVRRVRARAHGLVGHPAIDHGATTPTLAGVSFAVATVTGLLALHLAAEAPR